MKKRIALLLAALVCLSGCAHVPAESANDAAPGGVTEEVEPAPAGSGAVTVSAPEGGWFTAVRWYDGVLYASVSGEPGGLAASVYAVDLATGDMACVYAQRESAITDFVPATDGGIWLRAMAFDGDEPGQVSDLLLRAEQDGTISARLDMTVIMADLTAMAPAPEGGLYVLLGSKDGDLADRLDKAGNVVENIPLPEGIYTSLVALPDGSAAAAYYEQDGTMTFQGTGLVHIGDGAATPLSVADNAPLTGQIWLLCGDGDALWLDGGQQTSPVCAYDRASGAVTARFTWPDTGVDSVACAFLRDGALWAASLEDSGGSLRVFPVPEDGDGRQTLVLAGSYLNETVTQAVLAFNRDNTEYQIKVKDYFDPNDPDPYAPLDALNRDIIAGDVPDLFVLDNLDFDALRKQGLLADLTGILDGEGGLSREDFLPLLWQAGTVDGKLLSVFSCFSLHTLSCRMGDGESRSMTGERLSAMADGADPLFLFWQTQGEALASEKASLLWQLLEPRLGEFADLQAGTCGFDDPAFIELLELVDRIPYAARADYDMEVEPYPARLAETTLFGYSDLFLDVFNPFEGESVFCGWPSAEGAKMVLTPSAECAMSAKTVFPEGCRAFLETLILTKPNTGSSAFSVWLPALEQARSSAMEAGMTAEQADEIDGLFGWPFVLRRSSGLGLAQTVLGFVNEQATDYYAGRVSAEQTAENIQKQAALLIAERG